MGRAGSRRLNIIAFVVLLAALTLGAALRIHAQGENPNVQHDEAWSYASAAGKLGPFLAAMDGGLTGRWVPASEWRQFWDSEGLADIKHIATGLSSFDVHPPLYFGLLHGWLLVTGEHVWAGRTLNLVFAALTALGIFGMARTLGFRRIEGALAALVWAVSPAVVSISSITRQYDLVALTTVLLIWGLVKATQPAHVTSIPAPAVAGPASDLAADQGRGDAHAGAARRAKSEDQVATRRLDSWVTWLVVLWLTLATAAALLTHYQAVLLVAGGAVYVVATARLATRSARPRRWRSPLLGLAAGTLLAAVLAPGWRLAFGRERSRLDDASLSVLYEKLEAIAQTLGRFVAVPGIVVAAGVLVLVALALVPRTRRVLTARIRSARSGWWTILFFALVTAGAVILQNLLFLSMPPRISARYLAMAWPFLAFLPMLFFGLWPRLRYPLTAAFCLLVLVPATIASPLLYGGTDRLPLGMLADADAVIVDNTGVGGLPRFLWSVPDDVPVFVDLQEALLADKEPWRNAQLGDKAYYVSILRTGGRRWRRNRILTHLRTSHDVELAGSSGMAEIYVITPKTTD